MSAARSRTISTDGRTVSLWLDTVPPIDFPKLTADVEADVCVVGGGIAGLTTAYLLLKEGKRVIVLDDSPIGDGQTGRTSAHLASAIDDRFHDVERMLGKEAARVQNQSHHAAIDLVERIAAEEQIDCDFARLDGYLFASEEDGLDYIQQELDAALRAGAAVERVDRMPVDGFDSGVALRFARQGRFHPMKYLAGLCRAIERMGGVIHTGNHVNDVTGGDLAKGERPTATTDDDTKVRADAIVVATNAPAPINDWAGIYTKQASYRTYVVALRIPKGSVTDALYWDTGLPSRDKHQRPYHYVRVESQAEGATADLLIVGGEDHKVGQIPKDRPRPFEALEAWTRARFPQAREVAYRWSGQVQEPSDGAAYIGVAPTAKPNVYVITGDSGMGLTHATLGARLVTDLIRGRENPWAEVYAPTRKPTGAPGDFVRENLNAVATFTEYLTPGEVKDEADIPPGEGAILRSGLKKLAVYRDESGAVHRQSAVCTHLGCIVHWNPIEKSWDCPCHGSRFAATGEPVMGPAVKGLKKQD